MKTRNDITTKIDELMELLTTERDPIKHENICCQIDALLWVIGDNSGKALIDER